MPTVKKLVDKMRRQPNGITPSEADRVLKHYGYMLNRKEGSHFQYLNTDKQDMITIVVNKKQLKKAYVEDILSRIGGDDEKER